MKIVFVIAAIIACVQAKPGGPAAYSISAPSLDHASVGNTQENTVKGPYGQTSQSDYSSQVQTAHSQSHVQRSSVSHDAGYAPGHYGVAAVAPVAAHSYAAPAAAIGHGYAPALALAAHAAPAISYAAPAAYSHGISYAAPAVAHGLGYAHAAAPAAIAPSLHLAAAAPAYGAVHGGAISHSYISTPAAAIKVAAAPAYAAGYYGQGYASHGLGYASHGLGYASHGLGYAAHGLGYAAPAITAHYSAPVVKAAVAAPALLHGHGLPYGY